MFGLGWAEVGVIAIAAILIFGPKKIPELGSALGKTLRGFKEEMRNPSQEPEDSEEEGAGALKAGGAGVSRAGEAGEAGGAGGESIGR